MKVKLNGLLLLENVFKLWLGWSRASVCSPSPPFRSGKIRTRTCRTKLCEILNLYQYFVLKFIPIEKSSL
jgi:hypothetical protein